MLDKSTFGRFHSLREMTAPGVAYSFYERKGIRTPFHFGEEKTVVTMYHHDAIIEMVNIASTYGRGTSPRAAKVSLERVLHAHAGMQGKRGLAIVDLLGRYHDALQAARDHAVEAMEGVPPD